MPITSNLKEFMLATNLSEANGPDDKLRMAFKMYDKDSSGEYRVAKCQILYAEQIFLTKFYPKKNT